MLGDVNYWLEYWCTSVSGWRPVRDTSGADLAFYSLTEAIAAARRHVRPGVPVRVVNSLDIVVWEG